MKEIIGKLEAQGLKFGIVVSRFNEMITGRLLDGCMDALKRLGAAENSVFVVRVPARLKSRRPRSSWPSPANTTR